MSTLKFEVCDRTINSASIIPKNVTTKIYLFIHVLQVRGKDLPGAVMVMPMGLDAAIKKRVSGEFKSEVNYLNFV